MRNPPVNARANGGSARIRTADALVNAVTAFVVLATGTVISAAAAYFMARQVEHDSGLKFGHVIAEAEGAIENRIRAYSDVLLGVRAMFIASDSVTRDEFQTYIASLDLNRRYPGIQVVHYAQRVPESQRRAFEALVRYDRSVDPRGYPDFAIKPPGNRPEYFVVQYVEPMAGNEAALGLDLGGDAVRLAALERTRDSGQLTASGTIALAHDPRRHPGFAMRLPVYRKGTPVATVEQRREAFTGMVSTSFIVIDLMRGVLSEQFLKTMNVRIHDAGFLDGPGGLWQPSAENLMFDSDRLHPAGSGPDVSKGGELANLTSTSGLEVGGRRWNLHFSAREGFIAPAERLLPWAVFLAGAIISLLLFGTIRSLATSGRRAIYLAERITQDLRESEASLAEAQRMTQQLIEALPNPIFFKGTDGRYLGVNRAWETFFGTPREVFIGHTVHDLYPNAPDVAERLHAMDQVLWEKPGSQVYETSITTPDGRRHDAIYYKATYTRADGGVAGLIGTIIDITERKDIERRFELTFNYAAVGILHTSLDRRMLLANKRFLDMTGYSLEELRDQPTAMIIVPDDVNTDAAQEQQLLEGRIDTYQSEKRYLGKHGRVISTRRTTSVARGADGTPQYYIRVIEDVTETKLNEERYRVMFDNAAVGITRVDLNGALVDVNQKFCEMLGYPRDELLGKAVADITHPDDQGQGIAFRGQVTQGEAKAAIGEKRFVRKDGVIIWARRTMSVARDDAGDPQYVISVVEDITERKQLEQRFEATFNQVAVGIAHTGIDGRYLMVNRRFCEMLGYSESELVGQSVADFAYPEDREKGRDFRQLLWNNKLDKFSEEKRYLRKDGGVIWTNRTVSLARDASGQPMYFIRVIEDITARKEVEERYRATFDNAPVGIMHTAIEDYRILRANRKLSEMLGYTQDELLGMTSTDIVHPDYRFTDRSRYKTQMLKEEVPSYSSERKFLRKDGSSIWVNRTVSLVNDAAGKPLYFIRIVEDISERKLAEERQAMEHAVTRVLAEAETLAEAVPRIIQTICEAMGWHCGACWQWDRKTGLLRCTECWGIDTREIREFLAECRSLTTQLDLASGAGLIRRIYGTGQPVWIADISQEKGMKRAPLIIKAGLHGAFGFPLLHGKEVIGAMEFFHRDVREPDDRLVQITRSIGDQIAQFMVRQQAEERVRHLAHYDELTGLPNRSMFNERLSHALTHARRTDRSLATLFIDLDRFKNINDTLGHEAGDHVLKEVAARLRGCLRESDTVGRLGGDEFVVLIEEPPRPVNTVVVAQKILAAMSMPFIVQGQEFHVTASIGISSYPADGADLQTLMKNADIAMYRAKEQGKNNFQFYSAQINVHTVERLTLESGLRRALERDEFILHYQPKMDVASGRITGVEALLRWQQPAHGLIPPAQFIHLAEETGLIVPIGEWVLRTACAQNKAWQRQGLAPVRVAVNLSPRQFAYEHLLDDVAGALKQSGLDPAFLELEITESMVMNNPEQAVILLNKLKAFGIHLAIDDFGTGYSSLNYLKRFPIDSLKIDRTFIRDLPGDGDDAAITQAIIAMAHSLRLGVVAEGVETAEQLRFLRDYKCDEIQGYYFSRPQAAADIVPLLRDNAPAGKVRSVS